MNKKSIERWVDTAEIGSSVVYYTGSLAEDRCHKKNVADIPDAFADEAEKGRVDFFQKRKTKMEKIAKPKKPTFDYIARKIK
jgi:hypothetical protein|tara:strand:- start:83 stop:328 length:246 start_codon:yes stop_codon:yes gene_type:complete